MCCISPGKFLSHNKWLACLMTGFSRCANGIVSVLRKTDARMRADVQEIYWRGGDAGKEKEKSVGRPCMGAIHVKGTGIKRRKMLVHSKKVLPRRSGVNLVTATQASLVFRLL